MKVYKSTYSLDELNSVFEPSPLISFSKNNLSQYTYGFVADGFCIKFLKTFIKVLHSIETFLRPSEMDGLVLSDKCLSPTSVKNGFSKPLKIVIIHLKW